MGICKDFLRLEIHNFGIIGRGSGIGGEGGKKKKRIIYFLDAGL